MLQRSWLTPLVIGFWCTTMGWLVVEKILPSFSMDSPPGYQSLYASDNRMIPVAWTVLWNDRALGWAASQSQRNESGGLIVDSLLHFDNLPVAQMLPAWTKLLLSKALAGDQLLAMDARGRLSIDREGQLQSFSSVVNLPGTNDGLLLNGTIENGRVCVVVHVGDKRYETSRHLPANLMIGDELSPQATLPGLYPGRRWTVPLYNPLCSSHSPIELLHAIVAGQEKMFWENRLVNVDRVDYRDDLATAHEARCRLWVDRSGRVLKQEAIVLGVRLTFLRCSDSAAESLATRVLENAPPDPGVGSTLGPEQNLLPKAILQ